MEEHKQYYKEKTQSALFAAIFYNGSADTKKEEDKELILERLLFRFRASLRVPSISVPSVKGETYLG